MNLQEACEEGRKRGWFDCFNCGVTVSMNDSSIVKEHVESDKGCKKFRDTFGVEKFEGEKR